MAFSEYAHVSTEVQITDCQEDERRADRTQKVFEEMASGGNSVRRKLAKSLIIVLLLAFGLGARAMPAAATVIKFDDMTDVLKVAFDNTPCPPEGPTHCFVKGELATFFSIQTAGITLPPIASRVSSVLILEPASTEKGGEKQVALSDFMTVTLGGSIERGVIITIEFSSDPIASAADGSPEITEDGTFQDLTASFLKAAGGNFPAGTFPAGFKILMGSDIPIPEPSTLSLIAVGFIVLGLARRLRSPTPSDN